MTDAQTTSQDPVPDEGSGSWVGRWGVLVAVLALGVAAYVASLDTSPACEPLPGVGPGVCLTPAQDRPQVPDTRMPILGAPDQTLGASDFAGDVLVINFWGSWCVPCRTEQPELNDVAAAYADQGVEFMGVDVGEASETNGLRQQEALAIPYASMWDPDYSYAADFEVNGPRVMPTTIVVDESGGVAVALPRATTETELSALLDAVLAES